ncbi:Indole-3-glycerol phosphate synthase chloroplastic [Zea mays]|uniref:indole-3-glycerol-phosphate synthase n=1 Tax=Zea mays TaxID=4577 RepID=A0A1D6J8C5_MAIZE|nr:Indole-3-glycerol phosphate synthase chloroplastic [Zea mays]
MGSPRIPSCEVSGGCRGVVQDSVDEVATSSHAAEANAGGTTEQEGNGSPVAAAAAYSPVVAGVDGIRIRRRPVTGPAVHYVGPFQFRLENEGNTPRNILEKIIWNKDVEVSQARLVDENGVMIKPARSTVTLCDFVFWCWHLADEGEEAPGSFYNLEAIRNAGVQVHDEREMDRVLGIDGVQLIGINNRNLETFEVDITNTKKLLEGERGQVIAQKDVIVVGESALFTPDDISFVQNAGVKAVLVGESLIKQEDPGKAIAGLFGKDISHAGAT